MWILTLGVVGHVAQAQSVDSLLTLYKTETDPFVKKSVQLQLAWQYQTQGEFGKAIPFYREVLQGDSLQLDDIPQLNNLSFCYQELADFDNAIATENEILQLNKKYNQGLDKIGVTLQHLAALYLQKKDYNSAIKYNQELLTIALAEKKYVSITRAYNNLGYVYYLIGDSKRSAEYFQKTYNTLLEKNFVIHDDDKATILINLGVMNANVNKFKEAESFFSEAYEIRKRSNDPIKIAQTLNFLATHDYIQNKVKSASSWAQQALDVLKDAESSDQRDIALAQTYKILSEIYFKKNEITAFRKYNALYTKQQELIIQKEKRKNNLYLERQLDVERTKNQIQTLLAQQEKQKFIIQQSKLEKEAKENELQMKNQELAILKKENQLQQEKYRVTLLQNEHINQMLELMEQASVSIQQKQKIELLEKESELQDLQLQKKKEDIEQLQLAQQKDQKIKYLNYFVSGLLLLLLMIAVKLYGYRNKKNRDLLQRNETISRMNIEISQQNEELISINDQLNARTQELHAQNEKLNLAQEIIHSQNEKLRLYTKNLEAEVMRRTQEILDNNERLLEYTEQMEKFTYAISHNLRAPIARLLGLVSIISPENPGEDLAFLLTKIKESSFQLDDVIKDLSMILELRADKHKPFEEIDIKEKIDTALLVHDEYLKDIDARVELDLQVKKILTIASLFDSIFYNLVNNSIKFREPDKQLVVQIKSWVEEKFVFIKFSDNGIGLDTDKYGDKLFGLYKRFETRVEGKGLGLYLIKSHIESLRGSISAEGQPGKGLTFVIKLPLERMSVKGQMNDSIGVKTT